MSGIDLTALQILEQLDRRAIRSEELVAALLARMEAVEPRVRAFLHRMDDRALARARELDQARARGERRGRLHGVPIAIKDIISVRGVPCTCGSRILQSYVPPYDATAVTRLLSEGAVLLGKTNLDEFAMGSSTENSAFHPTANPWNLDCVPGGSSGGSAAALAAREAPIALGTDTGGSVRLPAAFCGVVGLKPTYGRISRYGLVAFASSLDQIGPMARSVADAALLLDVLAGHDPRDATSSPEPVENYLDSLNGDVAGLRFGIPREVETADLHPDVAASYQETVRRLEERGARAVAVELPHAPYAVSCYYLVATAEASSNLARYDGVRYGLRAGGDATLREMYTATREGGFGSEVKRRIMLGTYVLSAGYYDAYYLQAQKVRTLIAEDFHHALENVDAVLFPTSPTPAFHLGEKRDDPLQMYLTDLFTLPASLAGLPAISFPAGFSGDGLPIGAQLVGRPFDERTLLTLADAFERASDFHRRSPALA